jgi:hypothetical protein
MLKKDYRGVKKLCKGPGGWKCPCCNPFGRSPANMKPQARRLLRRVKKQEFNKELHKLNEG